MSLNSFTKTNYNVLFYQNPAKVDQKINSCGLSTCGNRAIACSIYEVYFNQFKQSFLNSDFYDRMRHAYYIICKNSKIKAIKHYTYNAINNGKHILKALGLITTVSPKWTGPDRIFLNGFKSILDSMRSKKSSFSHTQSKTSGNPKCKSLLQQNNTSKKIQNENYTIDIPKNHKNSKPKPKKTRTKDNQSINSWQYSTASILDTSHTKQSKQHAKDITNHMVRIANKDPHNAHNLFHMLSSLTRTYLDKHNNIHGFRLENLPGFDQFLQHLYEAQLRPKDRVDFKYNKHDQNYIKKSMKHFLQTVIDSYNYDHKDDYHNSLDNVNNRVYNGEAPVDPKEAISWAKHGVDVKHAEERDKKHFTPINQDGKPSIPIFKI